MIKSTKYYFEQQFEPIKIESLKRDRRGNTGDSEYAKGTMYANGGANTKNQKRDYRGYKGINEEAENHKGRNKRCVWNITPKGFKEAHFAVFPPELVETPIKAGCPENGIVLDTFFGSGTTGEVALKLGRKFLGIELKPEYIEIAERRLNKVGLFLESKAV